VEPLCSLLVALLTFGLRPVAAQIITTVAGTRNYGYSADGGPVNDAKLGFPRGVAVETTGNVYVADSLNNRIHTVSASSTGPEVWTPTSSNLTDSGVTALVVDPSDSDTLYAGTLRHGVFKSTNAGADWSQTGLEDVWVNVLAMDQNHPAALYAGTLDRGLLESADGGATWNSAGLDFPSVNILMVDPYNATTLLVGYCDFSPVGNSFGILFRSEDGGESWTQVTAPSLST
jgi:hypothetical protein